MSNVIEFVNFPNYDFYRKTGTSIIDLWYANGVIQGGTSTASLALDTLRYFPFTIEKPCNMDRIMMQITVAGTAGSLVRIGVYASINTLPTTLMVDGGTIAGDNTALQAVTINQNFQPGLYYFALNHNSAANPTFRGIVTGGCTPVLGFPSTMGSGTATVGLTVAETYGGGYVLPSTATTPTTRFTGSYPLFYFRLSI